MEAMAQATNTKLFERPLLSVHISVFKSLKDADRARGQARNLSSTTAFDYRPCQALNTFSLLSLRWGLTANADISSLPPR
ncbi:hypothetical protein HBI67_060660 [Parastagonospora nodorum]|nr:hypothetical protein HBI67_060660 [Parastagonospora nodorum]KAH6309657.1 hypothetical protein HBI39_084610 [Parastagonospora nodorum]